MDVCEGLETALAVETATGLPVWPLVNAYLLEHFMPPPAISAVRIWADKDRKEGGQKAALALKKRLWEMGIKAQILLPWLPIPEGAKGVDWNDVLLERGPFGFSKHQAEVYRAVR
ncbi:toprim domain-containing protein [Azotobacter sp. CWF10]